MYKVNITKLTKDYNRYAGVLIVGLLMIVYGIYMGINIKTITNNTQNYVEVDKFEKTREDYIFGAYKYTTKHFYKINDKEHVCEKTLISKYWNPEKSKKVYIKDFNHPEECMNDDIIGLYGLAIFSMFLVGAIFTALSLANYKPSKEQLKDAKYLVNNGILVKNAPYYRNITSRRRNGDPVVQTVIHVKSPSGEYIRFSAPFKFAKFLEKGGTVDVIYDPDNCDNYYVAKEINRISGNQESDYQKSTEEELDKLRRYKFEYGEILHYRNKQKVEKIVEFIKRHKI